jgi:CRISPR-associated protein Cmr3
VKKIKVRGPLLVQLSQSGENIEEWLVPAPADALLLEGNTQGHVWRKPLVPLTLYSGTEFNSIRDDKALMLVGPVQPNLRKPSVEAPPYWRWKAFEQWLLNPVEDEQPPAAFGHRGPLHEHRLHVSMNPDTLTAQTGALFETSGLEFAAPGAGLEKRLSEAQRLALAVIVDKKETSTLHAGLASLGGERRMVSWRRGDRNPPDYPSQVLKAIKDKKACRVILLTPACFEKGYWPTWLLEPREGVEPELRAIAIQHPQVVSGWDLEYGRPKPTRRLAPAGTVFFLSLKGENDKAIDDKAIEKWVKGIWMHCISDKMEDQNDGFGLAVLGSCSGEAQAMEEVKEQ